MKLELKLEEFLDKRRFALDVQKRARARLLNAQARITRVSVGGREYAVRDGTVELPDELAPALLAQGWHKVVEGARGTAGAAARTGARTAASKPATSG
jgi:hypothetical protein